MSSDKRLLFQLKNFQIYMFKTKIPFQQKLQAYTLEFHDIKDKSVSKKTFTYMEDLPPVAQYLFPSTKQFMSTLQNLFSGKNANDLVYIDDHSNMFIKYQTMFGSQRTNHTFKIKFEMLNNSNKIHERIEQISKRLNRFMDERQPQKKSNLLVNNGLVSFAEKKDDKKTIKQNKQNLKQTELSTDKVDSKLLKNKLFKIQDKKITIDKESHIVQVSLINKDKITFISVQIKNIQRDLSYIGQLSDIQIRQFLQETTSLKNSKDLFEEIKKNAKNQNKETVKVNQKQNKLQILIIVRSKSLFKDDNEKQQSIFAQIDIKPIKQQQDLNDNDSFKSVKDKLTKRNKHKSFDTISLNSTKSYSGAKNTKMIQDIKSNLIAQKKTNKKYIDKSFNIDTNNKKQKNKDKDDTQMSQMSFKKSTSQIKSKITNLLNTRDNSGGIEQYDPSADMSLSFTYSKRNQKSAKGFLLNKQHQNFIMKQRCVQLKISGICCAQLAKKVHKRKQDYEFQIKAHSKITQLLIIGIGAEQVGMENAYTSQYFLGYSPLQDASYECGSVKQKKMSANKIKEFQPNSLIRVVVNLKGQKIIWSLKASNSNEWKVMKEILIPHFTQLKDLFPTVFLRRASDKVEFIIPK